MNLVEVKVVLAQLENKIPLFLFLIIKKIHKFFIHHNFKKRSRKDFFIWRYIFKELFVYFFVMFLFYFLVFFVNQILVMMLKLLGKNLPLWDVILLMFYSLPAVISQTAPFATLTGFLMCLGRMNSDNEILIMRASGLNPRRIILIPVLILGIIVSIFSFYVNDFLLPISIIKYNEQFTISLSKNPFVEISPNSVKHLNENTIVIGNIDNNSKISDIVFFDRDEDRNQRIILSKKSEVKTSNNSGVVMQLDMNDSVVVVLDEREKNDFSILKAAKTTMNIFESSFIDPKTSIDPSEMTSFDILKEIKKFKAEENTSKEFLNRYILEYNKKYSLSFGALFFAFLALPLALIFGKQNGVFVGLVVGVLISVLYWSLLWIFMLLGYRNGLNGFVAMWIPNFVVGVAGFCFYAIMMRQ